MNRALLLSLLLLPLLPRLAAAGPDRLAALAARYTGYDHDRDGAAEIEALRAWPAAGPAATTGPLVLVLVEDRLLKPLAGAPDLRPALRTHAADLRAEGFRSRVLVASLQRGPRHQDGRTLLALRAFLRDARRLDPKLAGVVLVGRFPDAFLFRTCNWKRRGRLVLHRGTPRAKRFARVPFLVSRPEPVAQRADIVLADLDGAWEATYLQPETKLPWSLGVFPQGVPAAGGVAADFERGVVRARDVFHVDDG